MKRKITSWTISVSWDNGTKEMISDMPDDVADAVDGWLSEVERRKNERYVSAQ